MKLVVPSLAELPQYADALGRGFHPDNIRKEAAAQEELVRIAADPAAFVASLTDREARGGPVKLADGTTVPRLPGYRRWILGRRVLRPDRPALAARHVDVAAVCPGSLRLRRRALETAQGLRHQGAGAPAAGGPPRGNLEYIELTTDPDNLVSQKVITANGGVLVERFHADRQHKDELRFRIML